MRRVLACLCVSLVCASCSEESSSAASPMLIQVGGAVEPQAATQAREVAVDAFWAKVREASAAYPASSKTKLTHVAQTPTGPVVVEEEVVMSEYMRISQEENLDAVVEDAGRDADTVKYWVRRGSGEGQKPQGHDSPQRAKERVVMDRWRVEQIAREKSDLEASKRRRLELEDEIAAERKRDNRGWVIQELEAGIKSERDNEKALERSIKRLAAFQDEDYEVITLGRSTRSRYGGLNMPFGRSSFGPWDTGIGTPGR